MLEHIQETALHCSSFDSAEKPPMVKKKQLETRA